MLFKFHLDSSCIIFLSPLEVNSTFRTEILGISLESFPLEKCSQQSSQTQTCQILGDSKMPSFLFINFIFSNSDNSNFMLKSFIFMIHFHRFKTIF